MKDKFTFTKGLTVEVEYGSIDKALRKLKKKMQAEGVFQDLREHEYYMKPSERKRRDRNASIARSRKRSRMEDNSDPSIKTEG